METRILLKKKGIFSTVALLAVFTALTAQTTHNITIENNSFVPSTLTIDAGDEVIWTNATGMEHDINGNRSYYSDNPVSFSQSIGSNWVYSFEFTIPGVYQFHCTPHFEFGMTGEITVLEPVQAFTINFMEMTPHIGQELWLSVIEQESGLRVDGRNVTIEQNFSIGFSGLEPGVAYNFDFYADHNGNGYYDVPPTDHAWRLSVDDISVTTSLDFVHNTVFTDIEWPYDFGIYFSAMTPHLGQDLWLSVIEQESGIEVDRVNVIIAENFSVVFTDLAPGVAYDFDFFADHNGNGYYDIPPADHAWRLSVDDISVTNSLDFVHNTDFTNIGWQHKLTMMFIGMTPHLNQPLELYVYDNTAGEYVDTVMINSIETDFMVVSFGLVPGNSYNIDFFADHNGNGMYDVPPTDHAWRIVLDEVMGDTTVEFVHNTTFTDIFEPVGIISIPAANLNAYPNPATDLLILEDANLPQGRLVVKILSITGQELLSKEHVNASDRIILNIGELPDGLYLIELKGETYQAYSKIMIHK